MRRRGKCRGRSGKEDVVRRGGGDRRPQPLVEGGRVRWIGIEQRRPEQVPLPVAHPRIRVSARPSASAVSRSCRSPSIVGSYRSIGHPSKRPRRNSPRRTPTPPFSRAPCRCTISCRSRPTPPPGARACNEWSSRRLAPRARKPWRTTEFLPTWRRIRPSSAHWRHSSRHDSGRYWPASGAEAYRANKCCCSTDWVRRLNASRWPSGLKCTSSRR